MSGVLGDRDRLDVVVALRHLAEIDKATRPCQFLGNYGSSPHSRNYEFSDATINVEGLDGISVAGVPANGCDLLAPIVDGDLVEVWALNLGPQSYSTTMGGTNTFTKFALVDIVKYGSS